MLVGIAGVGKAIGVTTVAAGVAAGIAHVEGRSLLIEADATGGDLGALRDLPLAGDGARGVLGFAAAAGAAGLRAEDGTDPELVDTHTWTNEFGGSLMPLGVGGPGLVGQVETMWRDGRDDLARWGGAVVVDFGRWSENLVRFWRGLDAAIVVCRGDLAGLERARLVAGSAPVTNPWPTALVVNGSAWSQDHIVASTGLDIATVLAWDSRCAEAVRADRWSRQVARRSLGQQFIGLAEMLRAHV